MWTPWRHYCATVVRGCSWDEGVEEVIVIDYFLYTYALLCWTTVLTLLPLLYASSGNDL
jgi:hypothetical protein